MLTGTATVTAAANNIAGSYTVSATARGITTPASFSLTNLPATLVVNNPTDTPVAGETDLRQAITLANSLTGANTITFDPTVFATPQTIILGGTQLALTNTTGTETITGPAAGVTISGNHASRVFLVNASVTASISGLTISGGTVTGVGGGLDNLGTVTLTNVTLSGNTASTLGGGLYNKATATLIGCTVSGNTAAVAGRPLVQRHNHADQRHPQRQLRRHQPWRGPVQQGHGDADRLHRQRQLRQDRGRPL